MPQPTAGAASANPAAEVSRLIPDTGAANTQLLNEQVQSLGSQVTVEAGDIANLVRSVQAEAQQLSALLEDLQGASVGKPKPPPAGASDKAVKAYNKALAAFNEQHGAKVAELTAQIDQLTQTIADQNDEIKAKTAKLAQDKARLSELNTGGRSRAAAQDQASRDSHAQAAQSQAQAARAQHQADSSKSRESFSAAVDKLLHGARAQRALAPAAGAAVLKAEPEPEAATAEPEAAASSSAAQQDAYEARAQRGDPSHLHVPRQDHLPTDK